VKSVAACGAIGGVGPAGRGPERQRRLAATQFSKNYADYTLGSSYRQGIEQRAELAAARRVVIMCSVVLCRLARGII
jgi:hypothetical protein